MNIFFFPLIERFVLSSLVPDSIPVLCGSMDCNLFINDLTANIHIKINAYHICVYGSGLPHTGYFSIFIHIPVDFMISMF